VNTPNKHCKRVSVLILAAGAGQRMGRRAKCLLKVQGQSLLERLLHSICSMGFHRCVLVLGHHAADIQAHLTKLPAKLMTRQVVNPSPEEDPVTSLQIGLQALDSDTEAVMVLLADQPLIDASDIGAVCAAFKGCPPSFHVLIPMVSGVPGHPVMFDATVRADLLAAPGTSLRQWVAVHPNETLRWEVDNPHYTRDLDTPEDIDALARETGWTIEWPRSTE
jgi:molybdenum cofactor cytidylyltransferase